MKFMLTMALSALMAGSAFAQSTKGVHADPASRASQLTERMAKELSLTPEQAKQVEVINLKYSEQANARATEKSSMDPATDHATIRNSMNSELKEVLTPDQYDQWLKAQSAQPKKAADGREIKNVNVVE
ncbi:MAG: DUF4890 domain-containing protein [Flavobacteriales bacterium]|jgi:Spy/CpxP family protein refolding chaperone|nr:DUF4890 domain-containing protein [Flavobacteriales bacterium]